MASQVGCFLEAFAAARNGSLPAGAAFQPQLAAWLQTAGGHAYRSDVGVIDGRLSFYKISFELTLLYRQPKYIVDPIYERLTAVCDAHAARAPPSLRSCLAHGGSGFAWVATEGKLVEGVKLGFVICFPVAFLVLFSVTGSARIAAFAIVSIAFVVGSLLGTVKAAFGWSLGTAECISATIVLGLSVDYTVHFGHIIAHSKRSSRGGKVADAATLMGGTVLAGTFTTLGSSFFMFICQVRTWQPRPSPSGRARLPPPALPARRVPCPTTALSVRTHTHFPSAATADCFARPSSAWQVTFFTKMATLISGTIAWSILFAMLFFLPSCALLGPSGRMYSCRERLQQLSVRAKREGK